MGHAFFLALLQQVCILMYWEQVLDTRSGYWVGLTSFGLSRVGQFWVLAFILETGFGHWGHWVRCWLWSTGCTRGRTWIQALQIILFQIVGSGIRFSFQVPPFDLFLAKLHFESFFSHRWRLLYFLELIGIPRNLMTNSILGMIVYIDRPCPL